MIPRYFLSKTQCKIVNSCISQAWQLDFQKFEIKENCKISVQFKKKWVRLQTKSKMLIQSICCCSVKTLTIVQSIFPSTKLITTFIFHSILSLSLTLTNTRTFTTHTHSQTNTHTRTFTHTHTHAHIYTLHTRKHTHLHLTHTHTRSCTHSNTSHTNTCTFKHTHTHTHPTPLKTQFYTPHKHAHIQIETLIPSLSLSILNVFYYSPGIAFTPPLTYLSINALIFTYFQFVSVFSICEAKNVFSILYSIRFVMNFF